MDEIIILPAILAHHQNGRRLLRRLLYREHRKARSATKRSRLPRRVIAGVSRRAQTLLWLFEAIGPTFQKERHFETPNMNPLYMSTLFFIGQLRACAYTKSMLFTGKGDGGTTTTFGCNQQRISKSSELPEALGSLDELNAFLGLVRSRTQEPRITPVIRDVQETLFIVQAEVAGAEKRVSEERVREVEEMINAIEKEIPKLKGFSIAGGTELSAMLDVARTFSRRAERRVIAVREKGLRQCSPSTMAFLNRLSSLLFALARLTNHLAGVPEENPKY